MSPEGPNLPLVTDPRRIRALAHPVRLDLLEALLLHGPLTATEASERIGESPTTCSFHLRQLAKYGYVEEAGGGPGRRRPWRVVDSGRRVSDVAGGVEATVAAEALEHMVVDRWMARLENWQRARHRYPAEWKEAGGISQSLLYVSPAELQELRDSVMALLLRHADRFQDPSGRPAGALPVEFVAFAYPLVPPVEKRS